ncbi:protein of unknown function (plasmid) [Rhodovastum atsumiense]|nr:protein of unknown function [Rhodovastum atsumiense]
MKCRPLKPATTPSPPLRPGRSYPTTILSQNLQQNRLERLLVTPLEPLVFLHRQEHSARAAVLGHHHRALEGDVAVVGELPHQFACRGHDGITRGHL